MNLILEYRHAVDRLASAQKPGLGVPPYTRWVNRPIGRRLAAGSYVLGLTPDQVTGLSMVASVLGLALLVLLAPSVPLGILIGALMAAGYALDSADGQLARLRGGGGPAGEWLDHVSDQARHGAMHACVLVYFARFLPDLPRGLLVVPLVYGVASSTRFLSQILGEQLRCRSDPEGSGRAAPSPTAAREDARARLRAWAHLPADPGVLCLALALSGVPMLFFVTYALLAALNTVSTIPSLVRRRAELRAFSGALSPQPADGAPRDTRGPETPFSGDSRPGGRGTSGTSRAAHRRDRSTRTTQSS